jgi:hypothetical protein
LYIIYITKKGGNDMRKPKQQAPPVKKKTGFELTPAWLTAIAAVLGSIAAIIGAITGLVLALVQLGK